MTDVLINILLIIINIIGIMAIILTFKFYQLIRNDEKESWEIDEEYQKQKRHFAEFHETGKCKEAPKEIKGFRK